MALLHRAELVPSKLELIAGWIARQPFWPADVDASALERVASFRFDDPDGEVGIETLIVRAGVHTLQVPMTYRGTPLAGGEPAFIGTTEHSVLGTRWVYDATGDPVYISELVRAATTGGAEVEQYYETDGVRRIKAGDAHVRGSGHPDAAVPAMPADAAELVREGDAATTIVRAGSVEVLVAREVGVASAPRFRDGAATLTGGWPGESDVLLAVVRQG